MAISYHKQEVEKQKQLKRKEKAQRKEERKQNGGKSFEDMIAYVDENGQITDTPPDMSKRVQVDATSIQVSTQKREEIEDPQLNGRVEHFNVDKGYGFIKDLASVEKYFFHINSAPAHIKIGNKVTFELERGRKGLCAVKIEIIG